MKKAIGAMLVVLVLGLIAGSAVSVGAFRCTVS